MATAAVARQPFVPPIQNTNKDFRTVFWEFLSTRQKDITKIFGLIAQWVPVVCPTNHSARQLAGRVSESMGNTKNLLSAIEIPGKAESLRNRISCFIADPSFAGFRRVVFGEMTGLINSVCDGIDLSSKFVPCASEAMRGLKTLSLTATLVGASNSAVEQVQKIHAMTELDPQKTGLRVMHIARDTSYVALAILSLSSMFLGFSAAPWMFLACLTSGLLFTIGGFFYDAAVVNLDGKHTDANKVYTNLRAELAHLRTAASQA